MVHPMVNSIIYLSGDSERSRLGAPNYLPCSCVLQVCPQYSVPPELFGAWGMCATQSAPTLLQKAILP